MLFRLMGDKYSFETTPHSLYQSILTIEERNDLVRLMNRILATHFFNSPCVRLVKIHEGTSELIFELAQVSFFDFVAVNIVLANADAALTNATKQEYHAIEKVLALRSQLTENTTLDDALAMNTLPNMLALSCLIYDHAGKCFLVRRKNSGISAGEVSCSATGTIEVRDLASPNPILACAQRECLEELGFAPPADTIRVMGISFGRSKMQPAALVNVLVDNVDGVAGRLGNATDFKKENTDFIICRLAEVLEGDNVMDPLAEMTLTEIARTHINLTAACKHSLIKD